MTLEELDEYFDYRFNVNPDVWDALDEYHCEPVAEENYLPDSSVSIYTSPDEPNKALVLICNVDRFTSFLTTPDSHEQFDDGVISVEMNGGKPTARYMHD